jgi:hypothetical protein
MMNKRMVTAGLRTLLLASIAGLVGCQSDKPTAATRPTGAVPNTAANGQGMEATPPIIRFNQTDHD